MNPTTNESNNDEKLDKADMKNFSNSTPRQNSRRDMSAKVTVDTVHRNIRYLSKI